MRHQKPQFLPCCLSLLPLCAPSRLMPIAAPVPLLNPHPVRGGVGERLTSGGVGEGMPVRVRALGVSNRGMQGGTARGAAQAQGGLMLLNSLRKLLAQGISCPEFNGTCEGWDAWIRRWLDFRLTFCSMGVE